MRKNLPVTQQEYDFRDGETLLSATDLKGRITYANAAFVRVSGFEYTELLGKAHNIVRHPDVPPAAYQDLWDTLKQGRSWTAVVKNRRKNGDHYWVRANVAPVYHQDVLSGYLSVRTKPSRAEITAAERVFASFQTGRPIARFHRGLLMDTGWRRWRNGLRTLSLRQRLALTLGSLIPLWAGVAWLAGLRDTAWLGATGGGAALVLLAGWLLDRRLVQPLRAIQRQAIQAATGQPVDDWRLPRLDEIASIQQAIKQASLNLRSFIDDVHGQLNGLRHASSEIAQGSQHLSTETEQAASRLAQTASAMTQLASLIDSNADRARQAVALARDSGNAATHAAGIVNQAAEQIERMDAASQKIGEIVDVIDSIAFQTNILALNAAVEAARAGEQGRGFAVVAGEVRALAQRSAGAAKEIGHLIHETVQIAQGGVARTREAAEAMGRILEQNHQVGALIDDIHQAGQDQSRDLAHIQQTFAQLGDLTQSNAAMAEESFAAVQTLDGQTLNLTSATDVFRQGAESTAPALPQPMAAPRLALAT
ncbi:MAG: methyl-accepting chemotaxis protein [Castellaniella sp.]|uniref:methyl-accepting chemotaxis protein n=1 Tax=Castellaniella sp. TaxID=1955812 RepID=UPI002A368367|nr:methyl-accepting chemotaxis protein [Castellaniella sp.]MDY0308680.1 methyl-accepting chemotaxis protein [Castellaniella sp.]